jgi:transcriptional regulator with XRE-family HTH domain
MSALRTQQAVATEIRVTMLRRGVNQTELAQRLGHDQTWLSKRLKGRTTLSIDDLDQIARAIGVEMIDLMPLTEAYVPTLTTAPRWPTRTELFAA